MAGIANDDVANNTLAKRVIIFFIRLLLNMILWFLISKMLFFKRQYKDK